MFRLSLRSFMMTTLVLGLYLAANMRETAQISLVSYGGQPPPNTCRMALTLTAGFPFTWRERHHVTHSLDSGCEFNFQTEISLAGLYFNLMIGASGIVLFAAGVEGAQRFIAGFQRRRREAKELDALLGD